MKKLIIFFAMFLILISCSSFVSKEMELDLRKKYEDKLFKMKKDLFLNNKQVLKKGETVKLILQVLNSRTAESNIKVYVYKYESEESILKSERYLIVYLFSDDFEEKKAENENDINNDNDNADEKPVEEKEQIKYDEDRLLNELDIKINEYVTQK